MEPVFLSLDEILEIHAQQIERYGGSSGSATRPGLNLLLQRPRQHSTANSFTTPFRP